MTVPPPPALEEPPFTLLPLPGKGIGVIATRTIPADHLLFAEGPIIIIRQAATKHDAVLASFAMLPKPVKIAYLSLANGFSEPGLLEETEANILGVWKSNNFCLDDEGMTNAVFALSSRLNHACIGGENCRWEFEMEDEDDRGPVIRFYTDRTIEVGEELTHCYRPDWRMGTKLRREALMDEYGFLCCCAVCLAPEDDD